MKINFSLATYDKFKEKGAVKLVKRENNLFGPFVQLKLATFFNKNL